MYTPPGKVVGDWRPDNEACAAKYRARLGPTGPIAVGPMVDFNGVPLRWDIEESEGRFVRLDLVVGHAFTSSDLAAPTASGQPPIGSDLIIDIQTSVDGGTTWVSAFPGGLATMPRLAAGLSSQSTDLDNANISVAFQTLVRLYVEQVGSTTAGANILASLLGFMIDD